VNVLFLHQHFATREGAGGTRTWEFSQGLLRRGNTVTMVAQRRRGGGVDEPGRHKLEGGLDLILLPGWYTNHLTHLQRIWQFILFIMRASVLRDLPHRPDVVIASSTPLTIGIPGWILARRYGVPFVFEVRDLWPEAPIQLGVLKGRLLPWLMVKLERFLYRHADVIIPLSPGMEAGVLAEGGDPRKVITITNASDVDLFTPESRDRALLAPWGLEDQFVAIHGGSMGMANGLDYIVEAARELKARGENGITFAFAGAGGQEKRLKALAQQHGLDNVVFLGAIARTDLGAIVSSCDVAIASFADFPVLATNSPNKLFDGLAAGLPCIVNSDGWTRRVIETADAGAYVDVREPAQLADAVVRLRDDEALRERQARNALRLAHDVFARERMGQRFCDVIEHAAQMQGGGNEGLPAELREPMIPAELLAPAAASAPTAAV
jgi:glycosyltransferase involved in cell wall biosynthesis